MSIWLQSGTAWKHAQPSSHHAFPGVSVSCQCCSSLALLPGTGQPHTRNQLNKATPPVLLLDRVPLPACLHLPHLTGPGKPARECRAQQGGVPPLDCCLSPLSFAVVLPPSPPGLGLFTTNAAFNQSTNQSINRPISLHLVSLGLIRGLNRYCLVQVDMWQNMGFAVTCRC